MDTKTRGREAVAAARAIAEKAMAENRRMSDAEQAEFNGHMQVGRECADALAGKGSRTPDTPGFSTTMDQLKSLSGGIGTQSRAGRTWAKDAAGNLRQAMTAPDGSKALVSGSIGVPSPIDAGIVTEPQLATRVLDLLPIRTIRDSNSFSYLRQTVRDNQAAVVPDGELKPTSVYTVEEVEDTVRVIAHLSEKLPERYFADHSQLEDFLRTEMEYGLAQELEGQVVSGDGLDANMTGLLNASGLLDVPFATDMLTTARKAKTALEATGVTPTAFVLNPADAEAFDLVREGTGTGQYLLGGPGGASANSLWAVPRVSSLAVPAGTAVLADWTQAEVIVREDASLAVDRGGDNFTNNTVQFRLEGRYGFALKRAASFAVVHLTGV